MTSFLTPISPYVHPETFGKGDEEKPRSMLIFKGGRFSPAERVTLYQKPSYFYFESIYSEGLRFCLLIYERLIIGSGYCKCVKDDTGPSFFVFKKKPFQTRDMSKAIDWSELPYPIQLIMYMKEDDT